MTFSDELRAAREQRGITLRQISERSNVAVNLLDALERGEFEKLPGGIFSRGFVRVYAREVGLEPDEAVQRFLAECARDPGGRAKNPAAGTPDDHARAVAGEASATRRRAAALQLLTAAVAGVIVFVALTYSIVRMFSEPQRVEQPRQTRPAPTEPRIPAVEETAQAPPASGITVQRVRTAAAAEHLTIDIQPQAPCWVRLVVDGRVAMARLLEPGDRVVRRAQERIVVRVGDAAAFQYTLNDVPGRSLGAAGEVVTARIDKDNLDQFIVRQ
ncbi:MAG: helix-turn-helix domain-containing protein [Vicinamibacteraceae bacterium]